MEARALLVTLSGHSFVGTSEQGCRPDTKSANQAVIIVVAFLCRRLTYSKGKEKCAAVKTLTFRKVPGV